VAIQIVGPWQIATASNAIGSNQGVSSVHLKFMISQNVASASSIALLTRSTGSAWCNLTMVNAETSPASTKVHIQQVGQSNEIIYQGTIIPGQVYSVVWIWNGTGSAESIYLNRVLVASLTNSGNTETFTGTLSIGASLTDSPNQITITEVAVWDGYALSTTFGSDEVAGLLNGTVTPATTSTAATYYWTCQGTTGATPTVGDAGLLNSGTTTGSQYNLQTISGAGTAKYVADSTYTDPINVVATVTKNGLMSFLTTSVATGLVANVTAVSANPTVYVGGVQQTMLGPWWCNTSNEIPEVFYSFPPGTITSGSQTVTYTMPFGCFITAAGVSGEVTSPAAVTNSFGTLETVQGGLTSFTPNPTMKLGFNIGYPPMFYYFGYSFSMNARYRFGYPNQLSTSQYVLNPSTLELTTVATNTWFYYLYFDGSGNNVDNLSFPTPVGVHSIVFDDVNATSYASPSNPGNALLASLVATTTTTIGADLAFTVPGTGVGNVALLGTASVTHGSTAVTLTTAPRSQTAMTWKFSTDSSNGTYKVVSGSGLNWVISPAFGGSTNSGLTVTTSGSTYLRTVAANGTTVTVSYIVDFASVPNYTYGYNGNLEWYFKTATGNWSANDPASGTPTITNFWAFTPGDSLTTVYPGYSGPSPNASGNDRSDPYAISSTVRTWLTASNGNGPACLRFMEGLMNYGAAANYQTYAADVQQPNTWGWGTKAANNFTCSAMRYYNTDPTNGTYSWSSPKVYHPLLGFDGQDSGMGNDPTNYPQAGNYINLPSHGGQSDDGAFMWPSGNSNSVVEFVCSGPHGLRTGDYVYFTTNAAPPYPLFFPTDGHNPQTLTGNNVSVATGSTAIVFTNPVTLNAAEIITFDANASGTAYKVSSGSGTTYFIYPAYAGASSSTLNVTRTSAAGLYAGSGNIAVTGLDTFVFLSPDPINLGNTTASPSTLTRVNRMVGTSQIPLSASGTLSGTAAITHNTSVVTLTTAQYNQIGMSWVFSGDTTNTPYVVTKCTLSATAAVNTSSTSVTTSASVSGQIGQTWTFTGDSSGKTYVVTAGSGTSWTISPAYAGSTNLTTAAVSTSGGDVHWTIFGTYAGPTVTASTITSSMTFLAHASQGGTVLTYGFAANMAAQWPGCACWIPMGVYMSDACVQAIADEMAPYLLAGSTVILEQGLEHWNFPSFPTGWLNQYYATLMAYVPPNQVVNTYFTNPASPGVLNRDYAYVLTAAHIHDVFKAQIDTHNKGIQVIRMFGAFGADSVTAQNMVTFGQGTSTTPGITTPVPMGALCGASYESLPTQSGANTTLVSACDPTTALSGVTASVTNGSTTVTTTTSLSAGEIGQTWVLGSLSGTELYSVMSGSGTSWTISPAWQGSNSSGLAIYSSSLGGNLSVAQMHDIMRHILKYSSAPPSALVGNINVINANYSSPTGLPGQVAGKPGFYGYEWGFNAIDPYLRQQLEQDCDYHPEMANTLNAQFQMGQDAGMQLVNFFDIGGARQGAQLYASIFYQQQQYGTGSANVYSTIQGGPPTGAPNGGYGVSTDAYNESVKLPVIQQWFASANGVGAVTAAMTLTEGTDLGAFSSSMPQSSIVVTGGDDTGVMRANSVTLSIHVSPSRIPPNRSTPTITITLVGTVTNWTTGSAVSIQNSVAGTTTVTKSSWTYVSPTMSILSVTTGAGTGQFTVTIDGLVSPVINVRARNKGWFSGMSRRSRIA
jgi:hypothetical protein